MDTESGHIIVHFLYTGQYQTLPSDEEQPCHSHGRVDFKKAISAFIAAKKYGLTSLQELARNKIFQCAEDISIVQAAHGIGKDVLSTMQEDASWLQTLVIQKAEKAFVTNNEIFISNSFFSGIKSHKLTKLLGQHVAKLYHKQNEEMNEVLSELRQTFDKQNDLLENGCSAKEQVEMSSSMTPSDRAAVDEPSISSPPDLEAESDPWNFKSWTQKQGSVGENIAETAGSPLSWPQSSQAEPEIAADALTEESTINDVPPGTETAVVNADKADPGASVPSSSIWAEKKNNQKKSRVDICLDKASVMDVEVSQQAEEQLLPDPALLEINTKEETHTNLPETPEDVVLEPSAALDDSPVVIEPPPADEPEDPWGDWGASLGSSKKKKKKKKSKTVRIEPLPTSPPVETETIVTEDLIEPEGYSGSILEPERAPGSESEGATAPAQELSRIHLEASVDHSCPFRYKHLFQDDGWKKCLQCELYMRSVTIGLLDAQILTP